jgi:hypothetical protein
MNYTQQLAWIKLRETQRQRDRLHRQYDAIEARVARAGSPLERLRALHQGLRELTFAQKALHPDVRELDALYLADELGEVPPELIADRTRFLERELAQGRLRAEFTYAFGRILSEWTGREAEESAGLERPASDPFTAMWQEPPPLDRGWLEETFTSLREVLHPIAEKVAKFAGTEALAPFRNEEVQAVLELLSGDIYLPPDLRRQAAAVRGSPTQMTELAGVATILLNSLDEWDWPRNGVPLHAVWVRVKYRPYLQEDLITALFLELVGRRWADKLRPLLVWKNLRQGTERFFPAEPAAAMTSEIAEARLVQQEGRFLGALPNRSNQREGAGYHAYALLDLLLTVEREIRFARAAYPDKPLYIVQADLRDYYPSLSHELILQVLQRLGVTERWRLFFGKFLRPRVRYRGEERQLRHGLPLEHALVDLFAECVLWLLDLRVFQTTGIQLLRMVDDIWFLTESAERAQAVWREIHTFCRASGLAINEDKSGALGLGDVPETVEGLPANRPRWGLLRLGGNRTWEVDKPAFRQLEETLRRELAACRSVLSFVAKYNGYLHYIMGQFALPVTLGGSHLRRVGKRLNHMHEELFGPKQGLVAEVDRRLKDCFADARLKERGLPHALIYWPITAGGMALAHPLLHVASYLTGHKEWSAPRPPQRDIIAAYLWRRKHDVRTTPLDGNERAHLGWLNWDNPNQAWVTPAQRNEYLHARAEGTDRSLPMAEDVDRAMAAMWGWYYGQAVAVIRPSGPPSLESMEQLVKDFIERGSEVSGRRQGRLSPYWRWVVYTYGPSLLEALGTFRFLLTELVPLQLILENRGLQATATEEAAPPPASASDDIPF